MKLFQKKYTTIAVLIWFIYMLAGCSNPESKREAQKLLEKQAEVLKTDNKVESTFNKIQYISDSLKKEQLKLLEKKDAVKHGLNDLSVVDEGLASDIKEKKRDELKKQITDLEEQLKSVNRKILQLEKRDSILNNSKDTIYIDRKQQNKDVDLEEKQKTENLNEGTTEDNGQDEKLTKKKEPENSVKASEEQMLEILEGKKDSTLKKSGVSEQVVPLDTVKELEPLGKNKKEIEALEQLDGEITAKRQEIDSLKEKVANEAKKLEQKQVAAKEKKKKSVSKMTKAITIIVAIGLVLFIALYLLGKQGLSKKKSSKNK